MFYKFDTIHRIFIHIPFMNSKEPLTDTTGDSRLVVARLIVLDPFPVRVGITFERVGVVVETLTDLAISDQAGCNRQAQLQKVSRHSYFNVILRVSVSVTRLHGIQWTMHRESES